MANTTISGLSTAATTLNDADLFETEQGGSSKKVAASVIADYLAGGGLSDGVKLGGTAAANLLDDYEKGTWTPTYEPETGTFDAITYGSVTEGKYRTIGSTTFITGTIATNSLTVGSAGGGIRITGLPVAATNEASAILNSVTRFDAATAPSALSLYITPNATAIRIYQQSVNSSSPLQLQVGDMQEGAVTNGNIITFGAIIFS